MERHCDVVHRSRQCALLLAAAGVAALGCFRQLDDSGAGTYYGEPAPVGAGTARTYVVVDGQGEPVEVGIALDEAALTGLPEEHEPGGVRTPGGFMAFEHALAMPEHNPTPYEHATLDWNPIGHEPPGIYNVPHFDFHFYTIGDAERRAITPDDPAFRAKSRRYPPAGYLPAGYVLPDSTPVPRMGVHWIDPESPELGGGEFTASFLYGTWDGRVIFVEPMVTRAYLESKPDAIAPIAVPERYAEPGFYPTRYRVRWDEAAGEYRVALAGFVQRG